MDSFVDTAAQILEQDPHPALTVDELIIRMRSRAGARPPGREELIRTLGADPDRIRVLRRPMRSWPVQVGPDVWVVATRSDRRPGLSGRTVLGRLRAAIVTLGQEVEPGSMQSWARWNGLVDSERRARAALEGDNPHDQETSWDMVTIAPGSSTTH